MKEFDGNPMTERKCRKCGDLLRKANYFKCNPCKELMDEIDDDFAYLGMENVFLDELEEDDEDGNWGEWPIPDLEGF